LTAAFATAAGRTLGLLHRRPSANLAGTSRAECFDRSPPGIYTAHRGGPLLRWLGIGQLRLIDRVREHPLLAPALDRMSAGWSCVGLIHGDVKWENCLWTQAPTGAEMLKWIDWELADLGDSCWDAGCFVQAYLSRWVRDLPLQTEWSLSDRLQRGARLLSAMQPALRAFLEEYFAAIETHESEAAALIERIMCCAAARMIQMGLEVMQGQPEPTPEALCLLRTSAEIMARPREALSLLLADRA
jgi:aminoglycoside phosphotransferase (APT) family kinase protein